MCRGICYRYSCGHDGKPQMIQKCVECDNGQNDCGSIDTRFIAAHGKHCPLHYCLFRILEGTWICCCCEKVDPQVLIGDRGNVEPVCTRELHVSGRMFYCGHMLCNDCGVEDDEDWEERPKRRKTTVDKRQQQQKQQPKKQQPKEKQQKQQPPPPPPQKQQEPKTQPKQQQQSKQQQELKQKPRPKEQQQPKQQQQPEPPKPSTASQAKRPNALLQASRLPLYAAMKMRKKTPILRPMARPGQTQLEMERKRKAEEEAEKKEGPKRTRQE